VEGVGDHGCEYMTKGMVVVLGTTGKNFAAGMSGGIAYVLDETGQFSTKLCNLAGVDLEPVEDNNDILALKNLIERHVALTQSPRGKRILANWHDVLPKFVKVYPHEWKRVQGVARRKENYRPPADAVAALQGEAR
jgi:glutamate synthase domain-containing protein 3